MNRKPDELFELLAGLADFDADANRRAKYLGAGCAFLGVFAFVMLFVLANVPGNTPKIILALVILAAIIVGIIRSKILAFDVSDDLRRFVIPVLSLLREDVDPEQPIKLRLDLSPLTDDAHLKSEGPAKGVYGNVQEYTYQSPWVDCETVLADGNRLRWSVVDNVRKRVRKKRKGTKTKYKRKSVIDVEIKSREKKYGVLAEEAFNPSTYETREKGSSIALRNVVVSTSLDPLDPKELMSVIGAAYTRLQPLKKGDAA